MKRLLGLFPIVIYERICKDFENPGFEIAPLLEFMKKPKSPNVYILNEIFGIECVFGHSEGGAVQRIHIRKSQRLKFSALLLDFQLAQCSISSHKKWC
jgi:hypothetical protein